MNIKNRIFFEEVERLLNEGREVHFKVQGNSMRPMLRSDHDTVVLHGCSKKGGDTTLINTKTLRVGDVVLFRYKGHHIMHRIVRRRGDHFTMAGDGNLHLREECQAEDICAKMVAVISPSNRTLSCDSRRWRLQSRLWCAQPVFLRRALLGIMRRVDFLNIRDYRKSAIR